MVDYGVIKSVSIGNDKDTDKLKYICEVEFSDAEDIRTIQVMNRSGINSRPMIGHKVAVVDIGGGFEVGICSDDEIDASLEDGETEIYSINGTSKAFKILLKPNTTIIFNDGTDYAVRYTALETAFNELMNKHNDLVSFTSNFVTVTYNLHNHPTAPTGAVSPPSVTGIASTDSSSADITACKIDEMLFP